VWAAFFLTGCGAPSQGNKGEPSLIKTASGIEMIAVPSGWFNMGSSARDETDQKLHKIYVSAFLIDKFLVTQESYEKLMGTNCSHWKAPRNPVEQIRWRDAANYCNARSRAEGLPPAYDTNTWACNFESMGYRLPTEAALALEVSPAQWEAGWR
jgi:formylglycine-generating enzyme required for sulfatase activity